MTRRLPRWAAWTLAITAVEVALILAAWGLIAPPTAAAHTITAADCRAMTAQVRAGRAVKRAANLGCNRYRRAHAEQHKIDACRGRVPCVIRHVFGAHGAAAVRVAWCESAHQTRAANGQYLGLFQMGSRERARWGHGEDALTQARAAHRYFVATGRTWRPWGCKP